jgi:hypothetical protein
MLFNFALDYVFKEVQENQRVLKLNETGHVPFYTDRVDLLGENVNFIMEFVGNYLEYQDCGNVKQREIQGLSYSLLNNAGAVADVEENKKMF